MKRVHVGAAAAVGVGVGTEGRVERRRRQERAARPRIPTHPMAEMDRDIGSHMFTYDPMESEPPVDACYAEYQRAVAPYTLAIQIASNVAHYWLPTRTADNSRAHLVRVIKPQDTDIRGSYARRPC